MKNVLKLFVLASVLEFLPLSPAHAATYYVSPSGSDSSSGTSLSSPLRTIRQALNKAQASGDVVYVMAGTYAESVSVNQSGITLSAYQDQVPVIDGGTTLPGYDWGALLSINGNNNTIVGFEVKNSNTSGRYQGGYGIQIGGNHNIIRRMNSHHHFSNGVIVNGDYNTVEDSSVWQCARSNAANPGSAVWGSGMSAARNRSASALIPGITSYATIRRNKVFNNWGEGLSCYEADHCLIEDNIVYDNWTINFYLSDATNALVQRNIIYVSTAPAIPTRNNTHPPLLLADETASVPRSSGNTIINNFIFNTSFSAFGWTIVANSGLKNVLIANNTIVDGDMEIGGGAGSSVTHSNSQIRNNIILGRSSSVATTAGLTFSNNNWAVTPSLAGSSSDVVGDPRIARTGPTGPGALTGDYFKILAGSPVIDAAMPLTNVPEDFFKVSRGTKPDIGGHELSSSTSTTTPSPTPTPTPTPSPSPSPSQTPTPTPAPSTSTNLALNAPVTVSSTQPSDLRGSYNGSYAVDGNSGTRWSSTFNDNQYIIVDLGSLKQINRVVLNWEYAYGKSYRIDVSNDKVSWKTIYSTSTGDGGVDDLSVSGTGRYVRMFGLLRGTVYGFSLYEFAVYGSDVSLSYNRPVSVSSTQPSDARGSYYGSYAVDGNSATRWSSTFNDNQYITVDLGSIKQINRVVLNWETAYGKAYRIQVSSDNVSYTTIYSTSTGDGGIDDIAVSGAGRYVRMYGVTRGTEWGFSLYEFSVYGN